LAFARPFKSQTFPPHLRRIFGSDEVVWPAAKVGSQTHFIFDTVSFRTDSGERGVVDCVHMTEPINRNRAKMLKFSEELLRDPARLAEHTKALAEFDRFCGDTGFINGTPTERAEAILRGMHDLRKIAPSDLKG
jgi:hypothetical protein